MERFLLDLDHLPRNKKDALNFFMKNIAITDTNKSNLVCGLIFLGFRTLRGKSLENMPMNIPLSNSDNFKIRINFTNAALSSYLDFFDTKRNKRNCVLALLYMGICSFEEYSLVTQKRVARTQKKNISTEQIEEDIYLSGLTQFFEAYNSDYILEFSAPQKIQTAKQILPKSIVNIDDQKAQTLEIQTTDQNQVVEKSINVDASTHKNIEPTVNQIEKHVDESSTNNGRKLSIRVDVG